MQIYVTHSSSFDYQDQLYRPLRESSLNAEHHIVLPHEKSTEHFGSKTFIKECDLVLAEMSYPSTGRDFELGCANDYDIPILYFYKRGASVSDELKGTSNTLVEYGDQADMIAKLTAEIEK